MAEKVQVDPALIEKAMRLVFGAEQGGSTASGVSLLTRESLHVAFRKRALACHPDRADVLGVDQAKLNELFKRLHGAYRLLSRLIAGEVVPASTEPRPSRAPRRSPHASGESEPQRRSPHRKSASHGKGMYTGPIPNRPLRFAQFLYYSGLIDWQTMIDAIAWQMQVRPKIGEIGRAYRFLDHDGVTAIIRERKTGELFGNVALRTGKLDRRQLLAMIGKQRSLNLPIGRYFIRNGLFVPEDIEELIRQNNMRNAWLKRHR